MTTDRHNRRGLRYPELRAGCTACRACAQVCPDFCFEVWKFGEPVELVGGAGALALGDPRVVGRARG